MKVREICESFARSATRGELMAQEASSYRAGIEGQRAVLGLCGCAKSRRIRLKVYAQNSTAAGFLWSLRRG